MNKKARDLTIDVEVIKEEFALKCCKCGSPLSIKTIVPYIRKSHKGICKSCSMLGNNNAKKEK